MASEWFFFFPKPHATSEEILHVVDIPRDFVMSAEMGSLPYPQLFLTGAAVSKPGCLILSSGSEIFMCFALGHVTLLGKMLDPHQANTEAHEISYSFVCSLHESVSVIPQHEWRVKKNHHQNICMCCARLSTYSSIHNSPQMHLKSNTGRKKRHIIAFWLS